MGMSAFSQYAVLGLVIERCRDNRRAQGRGGLCPQCSHYLDGLHEAAIQEDLMWDQLKIHDPDRTMPPV